VISGYDYSLIQVASRPLNCFVDGMNALVLCILMPACFGLALLLQFAALKLILKALAAHAG